MAVKNRLIMNPRLLCVSCLIFFFFCCSNKDELPSLVVELTGSVSEEFNFNLGNQPTEGGYSITKQSKFHKTSEIMVDDDTGGLVYLYIPKDDFKGQEIVEITSRTSQGDDSFRSYLIVLRITVQ